MEHVVDRPCRRQLELICHRGDLLDDLEGSISLGHEFGHLMWELQIFPF